MLHRLTAPALLAALLLITAQTRAQQDDAPPPTPEQQKIADQMQELRGKIMDNMQKQGVDPREFFGKMFQQMGDGSFDINDFNQQLIDQGLIDADTLAKAQANIKQFTLDGIKRELGVTDDEWALIAPKIQAYATAQAHANTGTPGGGFGGITAPFAVNAGPNPLAVALRELRVALHDKTSTDDIITAKLKAVRDARAQVKADLAAAKKDLTDIITVRQEAILVRIGIMS
jgi:hypothetical protein